MKKCLALCAALICAAMLTFTGIAEESERHVVRPIRELSYQSLRLLRARQVSAYLPVEIILQMPELPNGCEITSLAMVLNYYGYEADKLDLYDNYLQHEPLSRDDEGEFIGYDPNTMYVGDARTPLMGFYCFAAPITRAANLYLTLNGARATAENISGAGAEELERYLERGQPVIVWTTLSFEPLRVGRTFTWILPTGAVYHPYANLHCVVLKGYDDENYYFSDPLYGEQTVKKEVFLEQYEALDSQAVTLNIPRGDMALVKSLAKSEHRAHSETVIL